MCHQSLELNPNPALEPTFVTTVLLLSGDTGFANSARRRLTGAGFNIVVSRSEAEALQILAELEVDAALLDYDLPNCDGIEICEEIRRLHGENAPPVLIVGEHYSPALLSRCINAGTAGLHAKSDDIDALIGALTGMIADDGKRRALESTGYVRQLEGDTDPLTGLPASGYLNRRLVGESVASYRDNTPLSLLAFVPDRFDRLIERRGRKLADGVLRGIARVVEGELRSRDCIARHGDFTFAVVLPDTPRGAATAVGRRLRRVLSGVELGNLEQPITITFSFGVACRPAGVRQSPEDLRFQALQTCTGAQMMGGDRILADEALTGCPLAVVLGEEEASGEIGEALRSCQLEIRAVADAEQVRAALHDLPVAMLVLPAGGGNDSAVIELFAWARERFPSVRRVLAADRVDTDLAARAVNEAEVDYLLRPRQSRSQLSAAIERLLFS
ncbi:MAG: diguanylate cyclase [Polyangia bacterium]